MNQQQFRAAARPFIQWAGQFECDEEGHLRPAGKGVLMRLPVLLAIPRSSKVPQGVRGCVPFHQLTRVYQWRAHGMSTGDFDETRRVVGALMHDMVSAHGPVAAMAAIQKILLWGGDRNARVGAMPFLLDQQNLVGYLNNVSHALTLKTAVLTPTNLAAVLRMNSMLTKVHAFRSTDGLPIYDSRVAGAIATIVETWRQACGLAQQHLPPALAFPEVGGGGPRRSVLARYPNCSERPGVLHYVTGPNVTVRMSRQAQDWASAKVRLGWLLSELLVDPTPAGIRSLEACLFMAGYNCAGINACGDVMGPAP